MADRKLEDLIASATSAARVQLSRRERDAQEDEHDAFLRSDGLGEFEVTGDGDQRFVRYRLSPGRQADARAAGASAQEAFEPIDLLRIDLGRGVVTITPRNTRAYESDYGDPRYRVLHEISVEGLDLDGLDRIGGVESILEQLPDGLTVNPDFGLAFERRYSPFVAELERQGVRELILAQGGWARYERDSYRLPIEGWRKLRRAMDRTHRHALDQAAIDKQILLHNGLFADLDPERFPPAQRPYKADTIFKAVAGLADRPLSPKDQDATLAMVRKSAKSLAERAPIALLELERDVRQVTLAKLVELLEPMLRRSGDEESWQRFLIANPFVLYLAFGLPAMIIKGRVSLSGSGYQNKGDRIADFLLEVGLADNLGLVEIKTPKTPLLASVYRTGGQVRPPSRDLAGAVAQIQDQRYILTTRFDHRSAADEGMTAHPLAVTCLVIIGTTPQDVLERRSFELYRNGLSGVQVITFDELVAKLRALHDFLASQPRMASGESRFAERRDKSVKRRRKLSKKR